MDSSMDERKRQEERKSTVGTEAGRLVVGM